MAEEEIFDEIEKIRQRVWDVLSRLLQSGDQRGEVVALREARECLETQAKFVLLARQSGGGLSEVSDAELTAETKRRGLDMLIEVRSFHVGQAPVHEWEELPASASACLPGRPAGTLYLCRKWVGDPHVND
jgi:hypothetical protein